MPEIADMMREYVMANSPHLSGCVEETRTLLDERNSRGRCINDL